MKPSVMFFLGVLTSFVFSAPFKNEKSVKTDNLVFEKQGIQSHVPAVRVKRMKVSAKVGQFVGRLVITTVLGIYM